MRSLRRHLLVWTCVLCLLTAGCRSAADSPSESSSADLASAPSTAPIGSETPQTEPDAASTGPSEDGQVREVQPAGMTRIPYTGTRASVQYITSAGQLPEQDALSAYDDAYFRDHALLLITETTSSGSVQVGVDAITFSGGVASVRLTHELPGDVGTADMATWLLWVELEPGLDYQWVLENAAIPSEALTQ